MSFINKPNVIDSLFSDIERELIVPLSDQLSGFFSDKFPELTKDFKVSSDIFRYPKTDILSYEDKYCLVMDLEHFTKEQVEINLKNGILIVSGESSLGDINENKGFSYIKRERVRRKSFLRSFTLEKGLEVDKIQAKFDKGLLTITIPKSAPSTKPKSSSIKID